MSVRFLATAGSYALETCLAYSPSLDAPCRTQKNWDPRGSPQVDFSGPDFWTPHPLPEAAKGFFFGAPKGYSGAPKRLSGAEKASPGTS